MATKKPASKAPVKAEAKSASTSSRRASTKKTSNKPSRTPKAKTVEVSGEQLVVENLSTLSSLVRTISETLDVLVQKTENMAYHLIATEEVLAEVVATTGVDLATVNKRIRAKIAQGTEMKGDPTKSIDVAAAIASPAPKNSK